MGVTAATDEHSSAIAWASREVSVGMVRAACRTPPGVWLPGITISMFVPNACNWFCTNSLALWPIDTMAVTAAMPITTPSTVRLARILFLASARNATRIVNRGFIVAEAGG